MNLEALCEAQILSAPTRSASKSPSLVDCVEVVEVAPRCPAQACGVEPGHLIVSINGRPVGAYQEWPQEPRRFLVYDRADQSQTEFTLRPVDPGIRYELTPEAVISRFRPESHVPEELVRLWESGRFKELEQLSLKGLRHFGKSGLWDRIVKRPPVVDSPLTLLFGGALFEQGEVESGWQWIELYRDEFLTHWTLDYYAIVSFYEALLYHHENQMEAAIERLEQSYSEHPFDRTARLYQSWTGSAPPERPSMVGQEFPLGFNLPVVGGQNALVLYELAQALPEDKLLCFCLMASYRGNGPYNDFMRWYRLNYPLLEQVVGEFIMVTMETHKREDRPHWFEEEDRLVAEGIPLRTLLDDGALAEAVGQAAAPELYLVDRNGGVHVHHSHLGDTHLWTALDRFTRS